MKGHLPLLLVSLLALSLAGCRNARGSAGPSALNEGQVEVGAAAEAAPAPATVGKDRSECGMPQDLPEPSWPRELEAQTEEPVAFVEGSVTLAVLPDTQYYASCDEPHFPAQGRWLASQIEERQIVAALHLGDLTENNIAKEWDYVVRSLEPLFDKVPLLLTTGNHDYGSNGSADRRETLFPRYFGQPKPATVSTVAESMTPGNLENAYYRISVKGMTLGVLMLEWSPRQAAVEWAREAVAKYAQDRKIFVTHAYLFHDSTRYDFAAKGSEQPWNPLDYGTAKVDKEAPYSPQNAAPAGAYDGEMLWNALLKDMPGLFLTLNGHVLGDGAGLLTSTGHGGGQVHQVLTNFQMLDEGGLAYLRLMEIAPDGASLKMKTYSPSLEKFAVAQDQNFTLAIQPPLSFDQSQ